MSEKKNTTGFDGAVGAVSPPDPEWGTARNIDERRVTIAAPCSCTLTIDTLMNGVRGYHCPGHTFAHLVSGESRLRQAMEAKP